MLLLSDVKMLTKLRMLERKKFKCIVVTFDFSAPFPGPFFHYFFGYVPFIKVDI